MRCKAVIELQAKDAQAFLKAIEHQKRSKRAKVFASVKGDRVVISIEAQDATSLRAALNTYLRIAQSVEELEDR